MSERVTLPAGMHYDVPDEVYRRDPCVEPSLTQSACKVMLTLTPAHFKYMRSEPTTKFDVGHVAHKMILGRGREIVPLDFPDWRTKLAREARIEAEASGKLAVLAEDCETGKSMAKAAFDQLDQRGYAEDWSGHPSGCAEVVAIAHARSYLDTDPDKIIWGIWLRALIDWLPSLTRVWDVKTSAMSCAASIRASLPDWCIQTAMHERILNILDPDNAGRREHRFVCQENFEPYALQVVRLSELHLTIGRKQVAMAESIWARCVASGEWPAYSLEDYLPEYPTWKMAQVMEENDDRREND